MNAHLPVLLPSDLHLPRRLDLRGRLDPQPDLVELVALPLGGLAAQVAAVNAGQHHGARLLHLLLSHLVVELLGGLGPLLLLPEPLPLLALLRLDHGLLHVPSSLLLAPLLFEHLLSLGSDVPLLACVGASNRLLTSLPRHLLPTDHLHGPKVHEGEAEQTELHRLLRLVQDVVPLVSLLDGLLLADPELGRLVDGDYLLPRRALLVFLLVLLVLFQVFSFALRLFLLLVFPDGRRLLRLRSGLDETVLLQTRNVSRDDLLTLPLSKVPTLEHPFQNIVHYVVGRRHGDQLVVLPLKRPPRVAGPKQSTITM
mmetsp:Transcript_25914/g.48854  ORF Transcript_25914/g.48854 Transcript_25914/m.48854 type:complete len:312 (-) Transcript_25914:3100-4035(-)